MFLTPLVLGTAEPGFWVIWQEAVWEDPVFGRISLPCGLRTNLASTPHFLRVSFEFDPTGISRKPAAFHDGAYSRLWGWDKDKADQFLRAAMLAEGATAELAEMYYQGVRLGGMQAWNDDSGGTQRGDFDTGEHFTQWLATLSPTFSTTVPGVL